LASHALVSDPLPSSLTPRRLARAEKAAQQAVALVASLAAAGEVPPDSELAALLRWAEGAGFDHVAAVGALHLVFGAGYFTSLNLVSVTSFEMLRLPVARRTALLEATPLATVVEEVARMISPVQMTTRVPREPVPVGQQ
jgi:cytochrome P450